MAAMVKYKYLGLSSVVEVDYPTPQVKLDLHGGTPGSYTGLDRFGRVINHPWINYGASPDEDVARIQHGYDRNSNRLWRQNDVARSLSKKFDQQYTYDGLNRLADAKTGLLNGSHVIPSGTDTTFQQKWSLDYVGNWSCFKQDDDGGGTFDLEQTRTANPVNEITNITATTGPTWITPEYDPAGNTTSFPKPAAPTESFTAVYDAWNRMVRVIDNETDDIVQENVYDGRNFRIIKKTYDAGVLDETRHIYYTSSWQAIEERLGSSPDSADPAQQYVWGIRYIDDLVLRDRDTSEPPNGVLNERLYAIQDPNWNVTTIIDESGDVQERYEYDAYGTAMFFDADWDIRSISTFHWDILYGSYLLDANTGLRYARYRIYHVPLGIWMQRDPLAYVDGLNLYQYVMGQPIYFVDPMGTDPYGARTRVELDAINGIATDPLCPDVCGPDITEWFYADLKQHLSEAKANLATNNTLRDQLVAFRYQAKYALAYKWMNFSVKGCGDAGKCVHTVTLAGVCIKKNLLGNIALMVIGSVYPPTGMTQTAIARTGYEGAATWNPKHPWSGTFGAYAGVQRADNLAAFGVGSAIASAFTSGAISDATTFGSTVASLLNDPKALNTFSGLYPGGASLGSDTLTFRPEFGGFNTRSCKPCDPSKARGRLEQSSLQAWFSLRDAYLRRAGASSVPEVTLDKLLQKELENMSK